jgi:heavy metal efflux system protein
MFRPMAITVCSALIGALVLALTVVPAATALLLKTRVKAHREGWFDKVRRSYIAFLRSIMRNPRLTIAVAAVLVAVSLGPWPGSVRSSCRGWTRDQSWWRRESFRESRCRNRWPSAIESRTRSSGFDEVSGVVTKIGRPDLATEAMGVYQGDVYVLLKPRREWQKASTKEQLIDKMSEELEQDSGRRVQLHAADGDAPGRSGVRH